MFDKNKKKNSFLFKCNSCDTILEVKFETEEEINDVNENKIQLDCDCGGNYLILRS